MTKKHFIALADVLHDTKPTRSNYGTDDTFIAASAAWLEVRNALEDFCKSQNSNFNRLRWLDYINGECGPNGGQLKKQKT